MLRPYRTPPSFLGIVFPTLKRGANMRCAYGAVFWDGSIAPSTQHLTTQPPSIQLYGCLSTVADTAAVLPEAASA
jgi:hypothetical protein